MNYKFTLITVCYNAQDSIQNTINSVLRQSYSNYEYIIKDGLSTDATLSIIETAITGRSNMQVVSQKDAGIYDAMNEAVKLSNGEYIYFLNSGDYLADDNVLWRIANFLDEHQADVIYGDIIQANHGDQRFRKYGRICSNKLFFLSGACICHQALLGRRELFVDKNFDKRYHVCADKEWELFQLSKKRKFLPMHLIVAIVEEDGYSKNHLLECERETLQCIQVYCNKWVWIYQCVDWMKHNGFCIKILRKIESIFWTKGINHK